VFKAVHLDFIAVQSRRVKQKPFRLVRVGHKIGVLRHNAAKVSNFLEETLFGTKVTTTEAPTP
jgi:hypothetical protein